ncbi:molybdenum cofactor biosynthesis protein MoaE [soil metagenome]
MTDWIELFTTPLSVADAERYVLDPAAGGTCIFSGNTRCETHADGRELLALDYEAYADMALKQLAEMAGQARERWPVIKLAILHRTGRVAVGEPSVVIAVSTGHRAQAFETCRFLIDELKSDVAIWKKEVWNAGASSWVNPL